MPRDPQTPDIDIQRKVNQLFARSSWQRTSDIAPDELVPGKIIPKATSLKADWFGPFTVDRPSVFQLMDAGVDVTHLVCVSHKSPDDTMFAEGRVRRNALGRAFCLAVGDYWAYVPQLSGDPAFFTARLSDASSDLPAAAAAIDSGGGSPGAIVVSTLNRDDFESDNLLVVTGGTPRQYTTSRVVPGGFAVGIMGLPLNTGNVYVGKSAARALRSGGHAWPLMPGQAVPLQIKNWNQIWVDADVDGEGVAIIAEI